jgi:hypothetical protein
MSNELYHVRTTEGLLELKAVGMERRRGGGCHLET